MAAIIFRALLLYFLFIVARTIYRTYKSVRNIQAAAGGSKKKQPKSKEDVIEAEFRHLD